ncbi:MAG: NAD(P)(+) transhydrogenase (Re/Si-specific) subunit beta [Candidatus Eremiobacteraeota bacterium]|nr:NAD(P)(+) transhydrogenase (Re/Si-specific) subunit beta [Candidatus Eremiobacteraeota bacterium]
MTTTFGNPVEVPYLVTGILFIIGLKYLSSPRTARLGNRLSAVGMAIALIATATQGLLNWGVLAAGVVVGAAIGIYSARRVAMTAMPQMVAIFNGAGGGAASLVALGELLERVHTGAHIGGDVSVTASLTAIIGAISFSGSVIAFLKLQEVMPGRPIVYPGQQIVNAALLLIILAAAGFVVAGTDPARWLAVALVGSLLLGVLFTLPIGGADMPVIISLLNSFTGLAAALTGFVLSNNVLIISGALVGASGTLLTLMMGRAMNRSVANVLFGAFGAAPKASASGGGTNMANVRSLSAEDVAAMLAYADRVVVVPGYGMAVAQAQHSIRDLADQLEKRGIEVKYAIHPVAGRMPGHMNVLLAEANVPYTSLYDMDDINPEFERTDVALVVGANDVTNPAARADKGSPIFGMPILDVDKAQNVIVLKRSMKSGFAGIDNPLYEDPKTAMLFGDAKKSIDAVNAAVKTM